MKKLTVIFYFLTLLSCVGNKASVSGDVQEIDGCEYIISRNGHGNIVSHKGNCKNPIHYNVIHDTIYVLDIK